MHDNYRDGIAKTTVTKSTLRIMLELDARRRILSQHATGNSSAVEMMSQTQLFTL